MVVVSVKISLARRRFDSARLHSQNGLIMRRKPIAILSLVGAWITTLVIISRALAVVSATPATFKSIAASAQPTDQILCATGIYDLTGYTLPNRHYVGLAGATIVSGKGNGQDCTFTDGEISGFQFSAGQFVINGPGAKSIHGNVFGGTSNVYGSGGSTGVTITHNTFNGSGNSPLVAYPGNNWTVTYNYFDTRAQPNGAEGQEAFHFIAACDGLNFSNNVVIGGWLRWAGEFQLGMTNLTIANNYIHSTSGNGISCATGGDDKLPFAHQGENIDIGGNTCLADSAPTQSCAVEAMGDKNVRIHDNYFSVYQGGILNGTGGQNNQGLITSNNVIVATGSTYADGDNTPWKVPPRTSTGDRPFKPGQAGIPPAPAMPTNTGAGNDGKVSSTPPPVITPPVVTPPGIPAGYAGTSTIDSITWAFPATATASQLTVVVKGNSASFGSFPVAAGATSLVTPGMTANWDYVATLGAVSWGEQCQKLATDTVSSNGTPATAPAAPPAPPVTPPATQPTTAPSLKATIKVYSDFSVTVSP